jgi:pimeloyl-ACP methyl ester carboxylesterase
LQGEERDAVAQISEESLGDPDPVLHSTYNRAVYPAWFADREMSNRFTPPHATSKTGAAVLARLRRNGYDWTDRLRSLSTPTIVIHGEEDPLPLAESGDDSYIRSARIVEVPASGHMPFWEASARFFSVIESFL